MTRALPGMVEQVRSLTDMARLRGSSSERLQVLDQVHPLVFGQLVAECMAAVAQPEAGRVVKEVGYVDGTLHGGDFLVGQFVVLPAHLPGVVVLKISRGGTSETARPG